MSERQQHRIRRHVLEVDVPGEDAARPLQRELLRLHRQRLLPVIDRCLTQASRPDRLHRIESLVVDLGNVDPGSLERDFVERLGVRLPEALAEHIRGEDEDDGPCPDGERGAKTPSPSSRETRGGRTRTASHLELLELFARGGTTPWWADASRSDLVDQSLALLSREAPRPLAALLRRLVGGRGSISGPKLRRIVVHASDAALVALVGVVIPENPHPSPLPEGDPHLSPLPEGDPHLSPLPEGEGVRGGRSGSPLPLGEGLGVRVLLAAGKSLSKVTARSWRIAVWEAVLRTASGEGNRNRDPVAFRSEALARVAPALGLTYVALVAKLRGGEADAIARQLGRPPQVTESEHADPVVRDEIEGTAAHDLGFSDCDKVYIENAGLVLLWPFLGSLFERLELMTDKRFHDETARQRAVGLLQYLVTEDPSPPEYQVTLGKVLCGMEVERVFEFGPPVSEVEAEECTELLRAAIGHAPVLNDMSVPGFRGTFLIRKGVLSVRHGAWLLRVERETYDVLLERFPWASSWVKLPWMEAPLRVEW